MTLDATLQNRPAQHAVSFAAPLVLLCLCSRSRCSSCCYGAHQRDRRRAAAAFAAPALTASVAPRRPRWRRHVPMLAFLLALAILIVAAARPQSTVAVPVERASIMLVTDVSGSMQATDVRPTRLVAARARGQALRRPRCPRRSTSASWRSTSTPRVLQSPTPDRDAVNAALDRLSRAAARHRRGDRRPRILRQRARRERQARRPRRSCCSPTARRPAGVDPVAAAQAARKLRIPSTPSRSAPPRARSPSRARRRRRHRDAPGAARPAVAAPRSRAASGGKTYTAADATKLSDVYERLGSQLGTKNEQAPDHRRLRRRRPRPAAARRRACRCAGSAA